ncbi:guanylate-binding protein [Plasmopara halstedii]|uniref:Guanylate-binding protein n=1 Tax=Plasmopara halstedii TaxID=4781 RepID=A0A0N7L8F8_PLAHL|nr:guanylate-binding protein [Plasmopara halstedii]CEG49755.1 guanylate-binding protein [Plasmopara halstedii]|eukprot:XP_024586124.1 guanylate-binding protein [Plasmopara halstedii]
METLKSMFFSGEASQTKAVKWLGMGANRAGKSDQMFISSEASSQVLQPLGDTTINLISIFGAARQGKSFLMNLLADQQDLFKISNLREPCTQGVDLSSHFVPLSTFSGFNGCSAITSKKSKDIHIGFVDAEGQGDRDITYDSRLVSPVLLASKVVLFNWKDSLQADRMLNLLAVLARAAQGIELADGANTKVFGHLHLVFRDWSFVNSTPDEVYRDLFQKEKGRSDEVNVRNLARVNLIEAFESINIWLFPAPVANTANLKDKIRFDQLQRPFQEKLRELRKCLSSQLQEPMKFYQRPLTAKYLSQIMPALVDTLNSDQVIMPESIYSSMVRAEAEAAKTNCEKEISAYCEAAGLEELLSSDAFDKMLHKDVAIIIAEAFENMKTFPSTLRKDIRASLHAFAEKEITIALHANSEKIAAHLSKQVDLAFQTLRQECQVIERTKIPMKGAVLRQECTDLLDRELQRLKQLPIGLQGARGLEIECNRIRQSASLLFDKLEVANDKAIQQSTSVLNEAVHAAKVRMRSEMHDNLDKRFSARHPMTVTKLQSEVETLFARIMGEVIRKAGHVKEFGVSNFRADLEHYKAQLVDDMNRRYIIEMRQILHEVSYEAREDLGKQITYRLEGKLPMAVEDIKAAIDGAAIHVMKAMSEKLQGWTILKSDLEAKSKALEKLGDDLADKYLQCNQQLEKDAGLRQEMEQYEKLRLEVTQAFENQLQKLEFPTTDDQIESVFRHALQEHAAKFLSTIADREATQFTAKGLREILTSDCKAAVDNQKMLNQLAIEKKEALDLAEKERRAREQERRAAEQKEAEINRLKSNHTKWLGEKEDESKRLRDKLQEEERKARELQQRVEEMKLQSIQMERQNQEEQLKSLESARLKSLAKEKEAARLKRDLEEMKRKAAEVETQKCQLEAQVTSEATKKDEAQELKRQLEEMKCMIAQKEKERANMELQVQQEQASRMQAEIAAQQAANAAELAARAAIEASRHQPAETIEVGRKRPLTRRGSEDVEMDEAECSTAKPSPTPKKPRGTSKVKAAATRTNRQKMSLAEARKAAQEEVEKRIQERAKLLSSRKKK